MNKKIKVYDVKNFIEGMEFNGKKYITHGIYSGLAILEGTKGVLVFDDEACGVKEDNLDAEYTIGLNDIPEDGVMYAMPKYNIKPAIRELLQANCQEMTLTEFVKRYETKSRIRDNMKAILNAIDEIGLNSLEYFMA